MRLSVTTALMLLCAMAAAAQTGPSVPAAPEDGGPRDWEVTGVSRVLNLRERPSTTARIVASYAPGTVLDNLGCQQVDGRVWCDVQQLGGGPRGYVAAERSSAWGRTGTPSLLIRSISARTARRRGSGTGSVGPSREPDPEKQR